MIQCEAGANAREQTCAQPSDNHHHTVRDAHGAYLYWGLRADLQWRLTVDIRWPAQPLISPANGRGHPTPPRTSASMQSPPSRGMLHGPDRSGHMVCRRNKRIDQRQPQSTGGARTGMLDRHDPRPVARTRPGSLLQGDSCHGVRCKTIP